MQLNWNAVEQKRDEIVSRINSLARKFPEGAYDLLEDTAKPSENEQEFVQIVSNKKNLKDQGLEFDYKKSRLNVITVKERKNWVLAPESREGWTNFHSLCVYPHYIEPSRLQLNE